MTLTPYFQFRLQYKGLKLVTLTLAKVIRMVNVYGSQWDSQNHRF